MGPYAYAYSNSMTRRMEYNDGAVPTGSTCMVGWVGLGVMVNSEKIVPTREQRHAQQT